MPAEKEHPEYIVKTVSYAIDILETLAESPEGLTVMEFAAKLNLSRNKMFRMLTTLCETGLVENDKRSGHYRLGICSVALGQKFIMNSSVVNYAHPIIEQLARKHGEAVYMSVIRGNEVLFLDMVDSNQPIKTTSILGRRFPFFTNAAGKVMKAIESRDMLERLFKRGGRIKAGAPDLRHLATELEEIRSQGVAIDRNGLGEGIISVAVAVKDYAGKVVCAITLIGPSVRLLSERLENEIIPSLKESADILSGRFGCLPA